VINELEIAEVSDTAASKLASILEISGLHIDPTKKTHIQSSEDSLTQELIDKIWETKVWKDNTFQSLFDAAESSEEIEHVNGIFLQIKLNPSVSMVKGLTEEMETSINKKRFEIKLKEIEISTKKIEDDFKALVENPPKKGYAYFTSMLSMEESLQSLEKERSQVPVINHDLDMMMSKLKDRLAAKVLTIQLENKSEVEIGVKNNIKKIKNFVDNIGFLSQITQIYSTDLYKETEKLISYLEDEEKKEYEALLASSIWDRVKQIEREMTEKDTKSKLETEKIISDIGWKIDNLSSVVKTIDDENVLSIMQEHDDLVKVIKAEIEELPKSEWEKLQLELENLFRTRKQHIRIDKIQAKWVIYSLDENGIDTSLYFSDRIKHKVDFKLIGQRQADGNIRLELHYDDGTVFNIEQYLQNPGRYSEWLLFKNMPTEMWPAEFITLQRNYIAWKNKWETKLKELRENIKKCWTKQEAQIKQKIKALQEQYKQWRSLELFANTLSTSLKLNPRSKLQLPNPKFMILEEDVKFFEQVSTALMIQKLEQKWIVVIESDPGIWKTESCRFIAGTTNREIERVQCSKMDPSDLFFSPQLKAGETTRKPAEWIKLMQKPGTMILFDEWDKLTPQCFERLHSLLDNARTIYDPQIGSIKANEDCLFIAARNTYERVSNPIVSRSNIITMNPPAETNEAFKIAKGYSGIEYFDKISYEEFKTIYANIGTDEWNEKLDEILIHIRSLVKIFKELRIKQAASTYNEKFEYEVSYRDAEQIFFMYQRNPKMSFKQIVSNLLIPKARAVVRDSEDKKIQESILSNIIESMIKE